MPLPDTIQTSKPMTALYVKIGEKQKSRNSDYMKPVALDYFKIGTKAKGGGLNEHAAFKGTRPNELEVELWSDDADKMLQAHLAVYDGNSKFCSNTLGGAYAMRRSSMGEFRSCVCAPASCALFNKNNRELLEKWKKLYPHANFGKEKAPGEYQCISCRPNTYFYFGLPDPNNADKMLTAPGEVARLFTTSPNSGKQLRHGLETMKELMNGKLAGLRVTLKIYMIDNGFGGLAPTVGIKGQDMSMMAESLKGMAIRRGMMNIDMQVAMDKIAGMSDAELAEVDAAFIYENYTSCTVEDDGEVFVSPEQPEIPPRLCTDPEFVQELIGIINLGNRDITWLQTKFGANSAPAVDFLVKTAQDNKIDIEATCRRYGYQLPVEPKPEPESPEEKVTKREDKANDK